MSTFNFTDLFILQLLSILIIDIVFILSPSLPEVRVRVTSETETARCGPGRQEKDWPGPERGRRAARWELYYYHTLTCSSGLARAGWWAWPGSSRAGCQTGQGSSGPRARPRLCGLQQISLALAGHWHSYRSLRLLLGHRIGFTQVSLPGSSLPCQKNSQQEIKFITCK